jgi:glutamine cyclotransferase
LKGPHGVDFATGTGASPGRRRLGALLLGLGLVLATGLPPATAQRIADLAPPVYAVQVVKSYPHDIGAFTQGLFVRDGFLYESTGLNGRSSVRKVRLETGEVLQKADLPAEVFGEGITDWNDRIVGLTWQSQFGYVLDLRKFSVLGRFSYPGEGWGITRSDRELIMSDGSSALRFLDPETLRETRRLEVTAAGQPVARLNELEWVDGEVFANVWPTDRIARIDPKTGRVVAWIDLAGLLPQRERDYTDVLNGIAYDSKAKRLFVTGKLWPKVYEIRIEAKPVRR